MERKKMQNPIVRRFADKIKSQWEEAREMKRYEHPVVRKFANKLLAKKEETKRKRFGTPWIVEVPEASDDDEEPNEDGYETDEKKYTISSVKKVAAHWLQKSRRLRGSDLVIDGNVRRAGSVELPESGRASPPLEVQFRRFSGSFASESTAATLATIPTQRELMKRKMERERTKGSLHGTSSEEKSQRTVEKSIFHGHHASTAPWGELDLADLKEEGRAKPEVGVVVGQQIVKVAVAAPEPCQIPFDTMEKPVWLVDSPPRIPFDAMEKPIWLMDSPPYVKRMRKFLRAENAKRVGEMPRFPSEEPKDDRRGSQESSVSDDRTTASPSGESFSRPKMGEMERNISEESQVIGEDEETNPLDASKMIAAMNISIGEPEEISVPAFSAIEKKATPTNPRLSKLKEKLIGVDDLVVSSPEIVVENEKVVSDGCPFSPRLPDPPKGPKIGEKIKRPVWSDCDADDELLAVVKREPRKKGRLRKRSTAPHEVWVLFYRSFF